MREDDAFVISALTIDSYDSVLRLWQACPGIDLSNADSRENIAIFLDRNPGLSLVAQKNGDIAGTLLAGHDGRRGYLRHLAVHPNYRRRGLGRELVSRCLERFRKEGIEKCHVFVFLDNLSGIAFWRSAGWSPRTDICVISKVV